MNAIDTVVKPDESGRYLHAFTMRNKRYTMVPGVCSTLAGDSSGEYALFRVWREGGGMSDVTIRPSTVLSNLDYRHFWEV